jgi:hypothetical protein
MKNSSSFIENQKKAKLVLKVSGVIFIAIYCIITFCHLFDNHNFLMQYFVYGFATINFIIAIKYKLLNSSVTFVYTLIALCLIMYRIYLH